MGFEQAYDSLVGLAVGDAFGAQVLLPGEHPDVDGRRLPEPPWAWTDDTEMASSVFAVLTRYGHVDQDALASSFALHHDPARGYGPGAERRLQRIGAGHSWQDVTAGRGSWGNGGAMRVAPLGAWFGEDLPRALREAELSAMVTHSHYEGIAGAVAVAAAAALRASAADLAGPALLDEVVPLVPPGGVRTGLTSAAELLRAGAGALAAATALGTGRDLAAHDTVPLALWLAARYADDYAEAMWAAARVAEDVDTVCAIVGGVITAGAGESAIPADWLAACEPLPAWLR